MSGRSVSPAMDVAEDHSPHPLIERSGPLKNRGEVAQQS